MFRVSTNTPQWKSRPQGPTGDIKTILKNLKEAGFDTYDFTMEGFGDVYDIFIDKDDYLKRAEDLRKYADELGLVCNQTHSYFPAIRLNNTKEQNEQGIMYVCRCLEVTAILGAEYCIVHPINDYTDEENLEFVKRILPAAHKVNVKICLENMWNWKSGENHACSASCSNHESFVHLVDLCNDPYVVACLDIGHAYMEGLETDGVKMIKALGPRLKCLHIHDNDCHYDQHNLPYTHNIPFYEVLDALADIGYTGDVTFECDYYVKAFPQELYIPAMRLMREVGQYFANELKKRIHVN